MALHELITNAAKYGALSVPEGRIAVTWSLHDLDEGRQQLDLLWEERGGPPVTPPTRKGFGSRLIERQLPMEFDGSAVITFAPGGVTCRLEIPLTTLGWVGQEAVEGQRAP